MMNDVPVDLSSIVQGSYLPGRTPLSGEAGVN